jgi:hypothetical protein
MKRGSVWNLVIGAGLLIILALRYVLPLLAGHMPSMEMKNLALDGALLAYAVNRFLRYALPDLPLIRILRIVGLVLLVAYFVLKSMH